MYIHDQWCVVALLSHTQKGGDVPGMNGLGTCALMPKHSAVVHGTILKRRVCKHRDQKGGDACMSQRRGSKAGKAWLFKWVTLIWRGILYCLLSV